MEHPWITPTALEGSHIRLVPLESAHAQTLCAAAESPETFRYFFWTPEPFDTNGMRIRIEQTLALANTVAFCVLERATGQPVGMSCYLDIAPAHRKLEIGSTWIAPRCRGTAVNPEMKLLMLRHAFEEKGAHRVFLKTHSENTQSRRAMEKLGAKFEGELREDMLMHDGSWRTSAYYSILENEWPGVKAGLLERLADHQATM